MRHIDTVWKTVCDYRDAMDAHGAIEQKRATQNLSWAWGELRAQLVDEARRDARVVREAERQRDRLLKGHVSPRAAARLMAQAFRGRP